MRVFPPKTRLDNSRFGYLYGRKSSPFWLTTVVGASAAAPGRFCRNAPWPSITHTVTITATRTRMATHTSPVVHRCLNLGPISSARNVRSRKARLPVGHSRNRGGNVPVGAGGAGWRKDHRDLVREHARTSTFSTLKQKQTADNEGVHPALTPIRRASLSGAKDQRPSETAWPHHRRHPSNSNLELGEPRRSDQEEIKAENEIELTSIPLMET